MPEETLYDILDVLKLLIPGSRYKMDDDRIYWHF